MDRLQEKLRPWSLLRPSVTRHRYALAELKIVPTELKMLPAKLRDCSLPRPSVLRDRYAPAELKTPLAKLSHYMTGLQRQFFLRPNLARRLGNYFMTSMKPRQRLQRKHLSRLHEKLSSRPSNDNLLRLPHRG
jgi:hypothetical protein